MPEYEEELYKKLMSEKTELELEIYQKGDRLKRITKALAALMDQSIEPNRWTTQSTICLNKKQKLMTTSEILECLFFNKMDELKDKDKRRTLTTGLSVALGKLCESKVIFKKEVAGERGYYYGLIEWLEADGETIKHRYNDPKFWGTDIIAATCCD